MGEILCWGVGGHRNALGRMPWVNGAAHLLHMRCTLVGPAAQSGPGRRGSVIAGGRGVGGRNGGRNHILQWPRTPRENGSHVGRHHVGRFTLSGCAGMLVQVHGLRH